MKAKEVEVLVARAASVISRMKSGDEKGAIVSHNINPYVSMESGETTAIAVGLVFNKKFDYENIFFNAIMRSLNAESYVISVKYNIFKVTYRIEK